MLHYLASMRQQNRYMGGYIATSVYTRTATPHPIPLRQQALSDGFGQQMETEHDHLLEAAPLGRRVQDVAVQRLRQLVFALRRGRESRSSGTRLARRLGERRR